MATLSNLNTRAAMLVGLFVILVNLYPDKIFFSGISILGRFLAQPGFPGFSLSLSFFLSCPALRAGLRDIAQSGESPRLCKKDWQV